MKKVLLLMAMLTIGLASINAQDNLRWGATVGMNSSNFSITGFDSKIGFHAGVKAEVGLPQISEGVYLDMGALLTLKGAKIDGGSAASIKFNPYYLEIPVHIGYKYAVGDDAMKRFDFGLGLKAGVEFSQKYQISIGYDWGLVENIKDSGNKNRNLMISLSCFF